MPSSVIAGFDYDEALAQLTVTFVTGRVYCYYMVPAECAAAFSTALSKGAFFNENIRDRFPCREVTRVA
jgi:hypothetical protein